MRKQLIVALGSLALASFSSAASAAVVTWNTWNSTSTGTAGSIGVTYAGPAQALYTTYPSYTPTTTFADGTIVSNAPLPSNNILQITGGSNAVQTLTFSQAVVNPVFAIWSLGQPGLTASFNFVGATPVFVAGGPNAEYGGSAISIVGNDVFGNEGNGTVMFVGTYSSLAWTNPAYEGWYGFNVGMTAAVPEPQTLALMLAGLGVIGLLARRRRA